MKPPRVLASPFLRLATSSALALLRSASRGRSPLVCLHGFMETWRTWDLVLPALERRHDVLAPTLPGHAGGAALEGPPTGHTMVDAVERAMDDAGFDTAHVVGNSLGGFVALQLAARGRARTAVAARAAGGWARDDTLFAEVLALQARLHEQARATAPHAEAIVASAEGRRRATQLVVSSYEHIPAELIAHQMVALASAGGAPALIEHGLREGYDELDAQAIACPVRIVWGTGDRSCRGRRLPCAFATSGSPPTGSSSTAWAQPAARRPLEAAQLILGFTARLTAHDRHDLTQPMRWARKAGLIHSSSRPPRRAGLTLPR
jgi:pimeloyl-ACP methyl ester carboxylesterase